MKFCNSILAGIALLALWGCSGGSMGTPSKQNPTPNSTHNEWTWVAGSNSANPAGVYGTPGTAAPGNTPGGREGAVSWTDASGNFWLFGGLGLDVNGASEFLNDLWRYSGGQWTWMGGSKVGIQHQPGVYGIKGTPDPANVPGARSNALSWTDLSGNSWMFGGSGWDSAGNLGDLNDLWEYSNSNGQWAWMGGANVIGQPGTYGVMGTPSPVNTPGARFGASGWVDASGNFWLFGGSSGTNSFQPLNDLWKFSGGQWTWMSGSNLANQPGMYGIQGTAAPQNTPGARVTAATWTDASGTLWLFGGDGFGSAGNVGEINDLWKFSAGQWTWVSGSNLAGQQGIYGTMGMAAPGNIPGARSPAASWQDSSGNLWLLGGLGDDTNKTLGYLSDLWKFQP